MMTNIPQRERLCLFTRYPTPGTTKTRLIPKLGKYGAADLQRKMTVHILEKVRRLAIQRGTDVEIRYEGGDPQRMKQWLGTDLRFSSQESGDIGRRMARAIESAAAGGFLKTIIFGSDIPGITTDILSRAFIRLKKEDIVLGPAKDGGYYLIGIHDRCLKRAVPILFEGIDWGTDTVLAKTLQAADRLDLTYVLLEPLGDVDWPEDLIHWEKAIRDDTKH
jgi:rSAM/selenodomain-associated transferase 1